MFFVEFNTRKKKYCNELRKFVIKKKKNKTLHYLGYTKNKNILRVARAFAANPKQ